MKLKLLFLTEIFRICYKERNRRVQIDEIKSVSLTDLSFRSQEEASCFQTTLPRKGKLTAIVGEWQWKTRLDKILQRFYSFEKGSSIRRHHLSDVELKLSQINWVVPQDTVF
jgi:ABC-type transport system involved in Fe-S cluster assembly fused permease/ATPase subunit